MNLPVRVDRDGPVTLITLDAPTSRHALTPQMLCLLADTFIAFAADPQARVAILTATGQQAFCAGGDLRLTIPLLSGERLPADDWDRRLLSDPTVLAASGLRNFPLDKPVIAAINGACIAAGFELLLGTDLRYSAEHAVFGLPEVQRGVIPFAGSMARLPRQIPHALAMELMMTGQPITAAEAWRIGLVNRVVPAGDVLAVAQEAAHRIAANAPLAVQAVKRTARAASGVPLEVAYHAEDLAKQFVLATDDAREGPRAFIEKRVPRYLGH
jgi:enoyl-CoA hydratase